MTKLKSKAFTLLLCGALAVCGGYFASGGGANAAKASEAELKNPVNLESMYAVGTEFTAPPSDIVVGDKTYPAELIVRFPDGSAYSKDCVTLDTEGKYILEYRAETETGVVSVKKEFFVSQYLYSVSGKRSSAAYGSAQNAEKRPGVVASLGYNERLLFNKVINLSGYTKTDTIAELLVTPLQQGLADALNVSFVLTDAYDSENYITVTNKRLDRTPLTAAWQERNTYATANAVNQPPTGLEASGSGDFSWQGNTYKLHQNDIYGAGIRFSMSGVPNIDNDCTDLGTPGDIALQSLTLSMDYAERRVYVNGSIIADLDDVSIFKSVQWQGFTTGECLLSVYASGYNQDSFNFVLTEAGGVKGAEFESGLIVDSKGPEMTMLYGVYEEDGFPDAVTGRPYPLPEVTAYDEKDKYVDVKARVYKDYATNGQVNVQVDEGAFLPLSEGDYTIVYTASDRFGNTSSLRYDVKAKAFELPLSVKLTEKETEGEAGRLLKVASATVENPQGNPSVKIYARLTGRDVEEEISVEGENAYIFRPLYAGEWEIVYEYSDYLETKTEAYTVVVSASDKPYFDEEAKFPKYIVKGATYSLPPLTGLTFSSGTPVKENAAVYLKDDDGTEKQLTGSRFTSYANQTVSLIYRLGSGNNVEEKSYILPVADVGYDKMNLRIKNYFVGESFFSSDSNDRITLLTETNGTQSFEFINPLQVFDFKTVFHVSAVANKFDGINIYLTDSEDPSVTIKASYFRYRAGNTIFTINDGEKEYSSVGDFVESSADNFRLIYNNSTRKISPSSDFGVEISSDLSGKSFAGFTSGKAYMRVELVNVTGKAGIEFISLNNQPMSKVAYDLIKPEVSANPVKGEKYLGDEITLSAAYAADVLDPDIRFTMSVTSPNGEYVVSKDNVLLDSSADPSREYVVTAALYGTYTVYYECEDANGNKTVYSYVFNVVDTTPPEVTLGAHTETGKAGDTVVVAEATASDDYSEVTVLIKVKLPDGSFIDLPGNSFVAPSAGLYTVYYFVYDADYNVAMASYTVTVH